MTSKLTREELRKRAKENINNLRFASKQRAFESARKEILADLQLAEYALEAMESEPYGFTEGERFGMVLEPRQWPAPKDGEPQLHIKEQPGPDIDTLRHAFETEEREETGGFNLHKSGIDYVDKSTQAQWEAWLVCRAAMLQAGISAVIPDGYVMVPMRLTAENGAKAALIGEFNLEYTLTCHECFGEGCYDCSGEGAWINTIPIDWTTIKEIWAKGVEHFAAAPQLPGSEPAAVPGAWIPVSERMPGSQEWVIVFAKWANQQVLCWDDVQNRWTDFEDQSYYADMFSHWMPLPAAPQEVPDGQR